jgi:hypothetical protein
MAEPETVIGGTIRPDGTLVLDEQPRVRPGRVRVRVEPDAPGQTGAEILAVLQGIWEARRARGAKSPSGEEVDAAISALRDEAEERLRSLEDARSGGGSDAC